VQFQFSEKKGIEALIYIASKWPGVSAFFASQVLFFAEKKHLNRYARPIAGDTFIATPAGPVPSALGDFMERRFDQADDPDAIMAALVIGRNPYPGLRAKRQADGDVLSPSDVECLDEAISFCRSRNFGVLSALTQQEKAWSSAPVDGPIDYEHMIEGKASKRYKASTHDKASTRDEIVAEAQEFAAYGVL